MHDSLAPSCIGILYNENKNLTEFNMDIAIYACSEYNEPQNYYLFMFEICPLNRKGDYMLCSSINIQKSSEALSPATENSAIGVPGALVQTCMVSRRNDQMRDDVEVRYFTWIISVYQRSLINELIPVGVGLSMWFFFPPYIQLRSIMQVAHTTITLLRQKKTIQTSISPPSPLPSFANYPFYTKFLYI